MSKTNIQIIDQPNTKYLMGPVIHGKTFAGVDLDVQKNKTVAECQSACLANNKCLYIAYDDRQKTCTLRGADTDDNQTAGIQSMETYDIYPKINLVGRNLRSTPLAADSDGCKKACSSDVDCVAYILGGNACYLKGFDDKINIDHSWKTIVKTSPIVDTVTKNNLNCCMNYPDGQNCENSLPNTKACDVFMKNTCSTYPHLEECQCINRENNHQYNRVRGELLKRTGSPVRDDCWYPHCRSNSRAYIPTDLVPISMSFFDEDHMKRIDNLRCVGTNGCQIKDIYNPDLINNCSGIKLSTIVPAKPEGFGNIADTDNLKFQTILFLVGLLVIILVWNCFRRY